MRVLIAASWHNRPVSTQFRRLAYTLAERGHDVTFIADQKRTDIVQPDATPKILTWPSKRPVHRADARFLYRLLRQSKPDVLIANSGSVNLMLLIGALRGVPQRVAWYHTARHAMVVDESQGWLERKIKQVRKQFIYKFASHIVANSQAAQQDLIGSYGVSESKITIFYNALAEPAVLAAPPERVAHRIVCVGRIIPTKGQDVLIRALPALIQHVPNLQVRFLGDGFARADNEQLARQLGVIDNCEFVGSVSHQRVLEEMASAAITVSPSRAEAFGLVNLESMAVGTPVVASNVGGIPEVVRDEIDGLLIEPDDSLQLSQALQRLLRDQTLRETMGSNGRQRYLSKFELTEAVDNLSDWLETQSSR